MTDEANALAIMLAEAGEELLTDMIRTDEWAELTQLRAELEAANEVVTEQLEIRQRNEAEIKRLRVALKDARAFIDGDSPDWRYAKQEQLAEIDAALAGDSHDQ